MGGRGGGKKRKKKEKEQGSLLPFLFLSNLSLGEGNEGKGRGGRKKGQKKDDVDVLSCPLKHVHA